MTHTPHDALFKAAFSRPRDIEPLFAALLPAQLHCAIAWPTLTREAASAVDPRLRRQHNDLLFSVSFHACAGELYLLLEHQSHSDRRMPLRLLAYCIRLWEARELPLPPIVAIVISHDPRGWTAPRTLEELVAPNAKLFQGLGAFLPNFFVHVADLSTLDRDDLIGWSLPPFPKLALILLRDARNTGELLRHAGAWLPLVTRLVELPDSETPLTQLLQYIFLVVDDDEFNQLRAVITTHLPQTRDAFMTKAESLRQEGHREGHREGLRSTLTKLLRLKFGPLSPPHRTRIDNASSHELTTYTERVLFASTPDAVFTSP